MDSRFDELFEDLKYLKVDLKDLSREQIQASLINEVKEILKNR